MRILLIGLTLIVTACASVPNESLPEPPDTFSQYVTEAYDRTDPTRARAPMPIGICSAGGVDAVAFSESEFERIEELVEAHAANVEIIIELDRALAAKYAEVDALVAAGVMTEQLAGIYRTLYENERRAGMLRLLGLGGLAGAGALIGIGAGL